MTEIDNYHFIDDIYDFFNSPEKPVHWSEFREFWLSLTPEEVLEFRTTPIS